MIAADADPVSNGKPLVKIDGIFAFGQRDRLKDSIFEKCGIPLLHLPTNGSGEIEKVRTYLERTKSAKTRKCRIK